MLTFILDGFATLGGLVALVLGFGVASVAALVVGGLLTLLFAGASTAAVVDDPYSEGTATDIQE
jgi:hypothetical protein